MAEAAQVLVIGAGPAGLAVAACLRRRGIDPVVVDRNAAVGDSWRWRYDRLHLHTPRVQSHLPGLKIPPRFGRWVSRDDFVTYLVGYARYHGLQPRTGVEVGRLERRDGSWVADSSAGELAAEQVVIATGYNHTPHLPDWSGTATFAGELVHASRYRNAAPYRGRDVLVVGTGNTGAEIAADLAEHGAARVRLAVRTPPNIVPREVAGVPTTLIGVANDRMPARAADPGIRALQRLTVGDLTPYGMPAPERGVIEQFRATDVVPVIDVGLVEQLRAGRVEPVAAVTGFDGAVVTLADGGRVSPDVVIAATGYDPALTGLVGDLGILDDRGRPAVHGAATHPTAPGLRFVGLTNPLKGLLLQINLDARLVARAVADDLAA